MKRREFIAGLGSAAAAWPAASDTATAQVYPAGPITIVIPFAAGGALDVVGRMRNEPAAASGQSRRGD